METVKELIEAYLTDEKRERFIANLDANEKNNYLNNTRLPKDVVIAGGFIFGATPEGADYWMQVDKEYRAKL